MSSMDLREMLASMGSEAAAELRRMEERVPSEDMQALVVEWLGHVRISRGLSELTVCRYLQALTRFCLWLDVRGVSLDQVKPSDLEDWQRDMYLVDGLGESTRKLRLTGVRRFFAWREQFRGAFNPAREIRGPKVPKRSPRKYSPEQLRAMLRACNRKTRTGVRDYAMLLMLYATGLRRAEVRAMNLDDLTLRERVGSVVVHGKGAKEREIAFEGEALEALREWLTVRQDIQLIDRDAVWVGAAGRRVGDRLTLHSIDSAWERICRRANIRRAGIHRMRVTFATDLYDMGTPLEIIQRLLGHEKRETTERYIEISEKRRQARMPASRMRDIAMDPKRMPLWAQAKIEK